METLFVGKNLIFLPEIQSTNSYAIDLLKNVNLPEGTVVHTANQTAGKGQRGSGWTSEPASNLTVSIILKPDFLDLKNQFYLYMVAALACYDTTAEIIGDSHNDIKIKWPNDILVSRKKIAGILIENKLLKNRLHWCVVGIGLNVNQQTFPAELKATSLQLEIHKKTDLQKVFEKLCMFFEKYYLALKSNKLAFLKELYLEKLFGLDMVLDFQIGESIRPLCVKGIGDTGLLILQKENAPPIEVDVREVKWLY